MARDAEAQLERDLSALLETAQLERGGLARAEVEIEACTVITRTCPQNASTFWETRLPMDLIAGPEEWFAAPGIQTPEGWIYLRYPLRADVEAAIAAAGTAFDVAYGAARAELAVRHPWTLSYANALPVWGSYRRLGADGTGAAGAI